MTEPARNPTKRRSRTPPVVYLDTQDYSRFGGVVEGRGDRAEETLFSQLMATADKGDAIFACSVPIFGELLSYDETLPHVTEAKARAVEMLCRGHMLSVPSEVVALEVSRLAEAEGMIPIQPPRSLHLTDYAWFPDLSDAIEGLRDKLRQVALSRLEQMNWLTGKGREEAPRKLEAMDVGQLVKTAMPEFARKYGLPHSAIEESFGLFLAGRITASEASRRFFSSIATPTNFVHAYFRVYQGEKALPTWISSSGASLISTFKNLQQSIKAQAPYTDEQQKFLRLFVSAQSARIGATILDSANDCATSYGVDSTVFSTIRTTSELASRIPAVSILGRLIAAYALQTAGLMGSTAKVETSVTGDILHAIYLPHVDIWRGDKRFAHLAQTAVTEHAHRIVPRRDQLIERIEAFHSNN